MTHMSWLIYFHRETRQRFVQRAISEKDDNRNLTKLNEIYGRKSITFFGSLRIKAFKPEKNYELIVNEEHKWFFRNISTNNKKSKNLLLIPKTESLKKPFLHILIRYKRHYTFQHR